MMCKMIAINLLVWFLQGHAKESTDKFVDNLADKLLDRVHTALTQHAGLDSTTLGKPGHLTLSSSSSVSSLLRPPQAVPALGGSATPWTGYQPKLRKAVMQASSQDGGKDSGSITQSLTNRRAAMAGLASVGGSVLLPKQDAKAIQGETAGRLPGTSPSSVPGFLQYKRPAGKQGGHGVGWSEIPPYGFLVPETWAEIPVSIADLGGTELDLRFKGDKGITGVKGDIAIVVAPVLRFASVGFNADVRIEDLFTPERAIVGFGTELTGRNVEDDIESMNTRKKDGLTYYDYELSGGKAGHQLISMTALKNRMYIMVVQPKDSSYWERYRSDFEKVADSFRAGIDGKIA